METLDPKSPNHILVGVGGTGGKVLKAIRKRIYQEFPNDEERDKLSIGFVYPKIRKQSQWQSQLQ